MALWAEHEVHERGLAQHGVRVGQRNCEGGPCGLPYERVLAVHKQFTERLRGPRDAEEVPRM